MREPRARRPAQSKQAEPVGGSNSCAAKMEAFARVNLGYPMMHTMFRMLVAIIALGWLTAAIADEPNGAPADRARGSGGGASGSGR